MEYLQNTELLIAIFGFIVLMASFLAYKGIAKSKGLPDNPILDQAFEQTKDVLVEKIQDEIQETKQEIAKKKKEKAPLVPPSDLVVPMPEVKKAKREIRKKKEILIEEKEDESDSSVNPI
jgi:hypothetical protein